ncbi:hypothetical protein SAMN02745163_00517 [Clostridium cavendishii DSM 21758]|uniref:Zinc-finger n=1 Tax=Clostridium cavendishii DSM 21758 TaxID=1121302 RepID=A0A1M6CPA0_9CLOT|nr:zf-HC2 domain-containing protein [Clostridium cavendishii]SHI62846.1 hypothetical protein SAMN02745163_00517 [Clostridium cavendishii DSM 21758]
MKCKDAESLVLDILENSVSSKEKQEFFKHLEECTSCKTMYEEFKTAKDELKEQFTFNDFEYFDNTAEIMNSIDQNLYKDKKKTIVRKVKDYRKTIITMAALLVLAITSVAFIVKDNSFNAIKNNQKDKYNDFDNRWDIIYSQNGNIIFKNFYKIKAYSKEKGVYFSIDLKEKGLKPDIKEEVITSVSKDGKLIFAFTSNEGKGVIIDIAKNKIYNLDIRLPMPNNQDSKKFEEKIWWSDNSRYLMVLNKEIAQGGEKEKKLEGANEFYVLDLKDLNNIKTSILRHNPETDKNMVIDSQASITNDGTVIIGNYVYDKNNYENRIDISEKLKANDIKEKYSAVAKENNIYIAVNDLSKQGNKIDLYTLENSKLNKIGTINNCTGRFINNRSSDNEENKLYLYGVYPNLKYSVITYDLKTNEIKTTDMQKGFPIMDNDVSSNAQAVLYYSQRWLIENPMVLIKNDYINITLSNIGKGKFLNNDEVVFIQSLPKDDYYKFRIVSFNIKDKKYTSLYDNMDDKKISFKNNIMDYEYEAREILEMYLGNLVNSKHELSQDELFNNIKNYEEDVKPFVSEKYLNNLIMNRGLIVFKGYSIKQGVDLNIVNDNDSMTAKYNKSELNGAEEIVISYNSHIYIYKDNKEREVKNIKGEVFFRLVNGKIVVDYSNDNFDEFMK